MIKIESLDDLCKFLDVTEQQLQEYFVVKDVADEITLFQKGAYVNSKIGVKLREIPDYCDEPSKGKWHKIRHVPKSNASKPKKVVVVRGVDSKISWVHPRELKPNPLNARIYERREDLEFDRSIKDNGVLEAIVVNKDNVIISGHRRWRSANKADKQKVPVKVCSFKDERLAFLELNNHRVKNPKEIYNEAELRKEISIVPNLEPRKKGRVLEQVAEDMKVSKGQLHKIEVIYGHEEKYPKIAEDVTNGKITVHKGFKKIQEKERIICPCCDLSTLYAQSFKGVLVCPKCLPKLLSGEKKLPAKPRKEKPKIIKPQKPKETWEHRVATRSPQVSNMEQQIRIALTEKAVGFETDKKFCLQQTIPDLWFPQQNLAVYLDGEVHLKRQDRDEALRDLLAKRHGVRVLPIPYSGVSRKEQARVLGLVLEAVKQ